MHNIQRRFYENPCSKCNRDAVSVCGGGAVNAQVVFTETFDYTKTGGLVDCSLLSGTSPYYPQANTNIGTPDWINAATSAFTGPVIVDTGAALTYSGYALSGLGRKIYLPSTDSARQSARRLYPGQSGKVYYSMMVKIKEKYMLGTPYNGVLVDVSKQDLNGTTIACVNSSTSSSGIRGLLVFNRADTIGGVNASKMVAGVSYKRDDPATAFSSKLLDTLQTYLMVVCSDPATATSKLWINPDLSGPEPAPDATCLNTGGAETLSLIYFTIYQRSEGPSGWIGGLRVGTSWGMVTNIAPLPLAETFNYKVGALCDDAAYLNTTSPYYPLAANNVSGSLWVNGSTSKNDDPILVDTTGPALTYTGYPLSGLGKRVYCPNLTGNTSNNRASRAFTARTGKTYYSILVNMRTLQGLSSSTSSGGEYIMGFYTNASFSTANGRGLVTFRLSTTPGKFVAGIRVTSTGTAGWVSKDLDTNTTHLIVVSHELAPTSFSKIWVNPPMVAGEPAPDATSGSGVLDANADIGRFGIYQRGDKPKIYLGGLLVDTVWSKMVTDVPRIQTDAPKSFALLANYPNPFNPSTRINFSVATHAKATLKVYNMLGQVVANLFDDVAQAGANYEVTFDASGLASGLYFSRLESEGKHAVQKMVLMK